MKEVDDGLTLLYLLGVPELELLGITTTFGNGRIDQVYDQTQRLANQLGLDVPVLRGAGQGKHRPKTPAADFLVEQVNRYPKEITLLATGPVVNIHAASVLDSDFYKKVKRIAVMGGYLTPLRLGYRNLQELNFSANPEAAYSLLYSPSKVTVFPGRACLDLPYTMRQIQQADFWPHNLKTILRRWLIAFGIYCGITKFYLWDLLPAIYLTDPELFKLTRFPLASTRQDLQSGMLIRGAAQAGDPVINLAKGVKDRVAIYQRLEKAWQRTASNYPLENIH